jgi:hypothetical protein
MKKKYKTFNAITLLNLNIALKYSKTGILKYVGNCWNKHDIFSLVPFHIMLWNSLTEYAIILKQYLLSSVEVTQLYFSRRLIFHLLGYCSVHFQTKDFSEFWMLNEPSWNKNVARTFMWAFVIISKWLR